MPERIDETGFGGVRLIQDSEAFCYGVDAVILADFSQAREGDSVMDLCCGNGAVAFIIKAKFGPKLIRGMDIQEKSVDLANRSAALNGFSDDMSFICADALDTAEHFEAESFSLVVCNPPYFEGSRGVACESGAKHLARHESSAGLEDFFRASAYLLKKGGRLCMVHRPERLADLMSLSRAAGLEAKRVRPVVPHPGEAPRHILCEFIKGAGRGVSFLPELAVRDAAGNYTEELNSIYCRDSK